jgi:hypothetical protein
MRGAAPVVAASIVLLLLSVRVGVQGQSPASATRAVRSPLAEAIWNDDLATVRRFLASGADPVEPDEQGPPPFLAP